MRLDVWKVFPIAAMLAVSLYACGGGPAATDVTDAVQDVPTDSLTPDSGNDVIRPDANVDTGDTAGDEGRDTGDTGETGDDGNPDITDNGDDGNDPADTPDAPDQVEPDAGDIHDDLPPDSTDVQTFQCISDDECIGKVVPGKCQVPWCNDDNECDLAMAEDDTLCTDDSICTEADRCVDGECVGTPVDCADDDECTMDLCDQANFCFHRPYYGPCDDGNKCTDNDSCGTGICVGTQITCNDDNTCTTDSCSPANGCVFTKISGTKCDDRDPCTASDVCVAGECKGTFSCDDGNPCTFDGCNELGCTHEGGPLEGQICDDGLGCTEGDSCRAGVCTGDPVVCDDGNVCTNDFCQEGLGCRTTNNSDTCDDGNPCTRLDRCQIGVCKGVTYTCTKGTCMDANVCDGNGGCIPDFSDYGTPCSSDGKQCTDDICSGNGTCIHPNSGVGTPCNDGNLCTQTDTCSNGVCVGNDPVVCQVVDACKDAGTCDPATGTCTLGALPEGTACNDGNRCTSGDKCISKTCTGTPVVCPAITDCHLAGQCNPDDGTCSEVFKDNGQPCNDNNLCTQVDQCIDGVCTGSSPVQCVALDQCHEPGTCQSGTGMCSNPNSPNTKLCNDGNSCTKQDTCTNGTCVGTTYSCNDNKSCTADSCDGLGGCSYTVVGGWCHIGGECRLPGATMDGNMCMVCDPASDDDGWTATTGGPCNDDNGCTIDDICTEGVCGGTAYSCDDGIACTTDTCDGIGGCINSIKPGFCLIDNVCYQDNQQNPEDPCEVCNIQYSKTEFMARFNGDPCDDGVACTFQDQCISGICSGTEYTCNDDIACTEDTCKGDGTCLFVAIAGYCFIDEECVLENTVKPGNACAACLPAVSKQFWSAYREGEGCDDGSNCTIEDACASGDCIGKYKCDDLMDCTADSCNEAGECSHVVAENYCAINGNCYFYGDQRGLNQCSRCIPPTSNTSWTATDGFGCSDGDPCTTNDKCQGESCAGTPIVCNDGLECTTDFCQYGLCGTVPVSGWCVIGSSCVAEGTLDPANECQICDPASNPYDWSPYNFVTCDDGQACSANDICFAGLCYGQAYDCNDGVPCTVDQCDGLGGCSYGIKAGECLIDGGCYEALDPNILNPCQDCNPTVSQLQWSSIDGLACNDGVSCTSNDQCMDSECVGEAYECNDGLACTSDSCNGDGTCTFSRLGGWCLIDNTCIRDQTLEPGNICRACLSALEGFDWSDNNDVPCDDGLACTKIDTCMAGSCGGTAYACSDGLDCTTDACDGQGGCIFTQLETSCLIDGRCFANGSPNPDSICQKCDVSVSILSWVPNNGQFCNDFDSCTVNDMCSEGECVGQEYNCLDSVECTLDLCDGSGGCSNPLAPNACLIDGTCYWQGEPRPGIPCQACVPDPLNPDSQYEWTDLNPGAIEICNGIDDNCDGILDPENAPGCLDYYRDEDGDGVGVLEDVKCLCAPLDFYRTLVPGDCDDDEPMVYAGRAEDCDGLDNDCDGVTDPDNTPGCIVFYFDNDGDTWGVEDNSRCLCNPQGKFSTAQFGDCDESRAMVNPAAEEVCNGIDDNCDGRTDPPNLPGCVTYYLDTDKDTFGDATTFKCLCQPTAEFNVTNSSDCNDFSDTVYPGAPERCNMIDDDCSGLPDDADLLELCPHDPATLNNAVMFCEGTCKIRCNGANLSAGQPAWYDLDGSAANGCECQGDALELTYSMSQSEPAPLGSLVDDEALTSYQIAKISSVGAEDWFIVTGIDAPDSTMTEIDSDNYHLDIRFNVNPSNEFVFDVFKEVQIGDQTQVLQICTSSLNWNHYTDFFTGGVGEGVCSSNYVEACTAPEDLARCLVVEGANAPNRCNACPGWASPGANFCANQTETLLVKVRRKAGASPTCSQYKLEASNGVR